jgi:hypothetical protein
MVECEGWTGGVAQEPQRGFGRERTWLQPPQGKLFDEEELNRFPCGHIPSRPLGRRATRSSQDHQPKLSMDGNPSGCVPDEDGRFSSDDVAFAARG